MRLHVFLHFQNIRQRFIFSCASVTIQPTAYSPTASCRVQTTFSGHVNNVGKSREFTPKGTHTEKDEFLP